MSTEAKEQDDLNENDIFGYGDDSLFDGDDGEEVDLSDFDGFQNPNPEEQEEEEQEEEEDEEEDLFNDEQEEEEEQEEAEEEFTDEDLALFNKKLDKDFKTKEELKEFLNKSDQKEEKQEELTEAEKADNVIDFFGPLLDPRKTSDEDLMRKEYEQIAVQEGKDLSDEDVQYDINERIQDLIDARQLDLRADKLRDQLRNDILKPAMDKKKDIEQKEAQRQEEQKKSEREEVQNALADIYKNDNFYGVKVEKEILNKVYKDLSSGEFLKRLQSDKNLQAEIAMMEAYKENIYKKSSQGLSYSDGMKTVLDEFKSKKEQSSGSAITRAQRKGTTGGTDAGQGLIASLTR